MAKFSAARAGEGTETAERVIIEHIEEFDKTVLFVAWSGNGYDEATSWMLCDEDAACNLDHWL